MCVNYTTKFSSMKKTKSDILVRQSILAQLQLRMLCWMRHARMTTVVAFDQRRTVMATALQMTHCCLMKGLDLQLEVISSMHSYRLQVANTQHSVKQAEAEPVMHNFTSFNSLRWINFNVNSSQAGQIAMAGNFVSKS